MSLELRISTKLPIAEIITQKLLFFLVGIIILFVQGCAGSTPPPAPDNNRVAVTAATGAAAGAAIGAFAGGITTPIGAAIGGITGAAMGKALAEKDGIMAELDRDHFAIIKVGADYMLVLPSDTYFYTNSTHINEAFYPALNNIAQFLRNNETEMIKVAGYTDNIGDKTRNLALSRQQAQNIANYLWRQGLNARMIYATGYGEKYPIANNDTDDGRLANRRVQITFRVIPKEEV